MSDTVNARPNHGCLFDIASEQSGFFTVDQAHTCNFTWRTLLYHTHRGRFRHIRRGLYRLRDFPLSPHEDIVAAWLAAGRDASVISHESALDLLELADVIPNAIHLTVPRSRRGLTVPSGTRVHTSGKPLLPDEVITIDGIRVTTAARTIVDVTEADLAPDQVELAIANALSRGIATPDELAEQAARRGRRVAEEIKRVLRMAKQQAAAS